MRVEKILNKLLKFQDKFLSQVDDLIDKEEDIEGRTGLFTVYGEGGGDFKLMVKNGRIAWADNNAEILHHFKTHEDTFLSLIVNEISLQEAMNKRLVSIEDKKTGQLDLVEMYKWQEGFNRLGNTLREIMKRR